MANYRDDEVSTAVVSETYSAWLGVRLQDVATAATVLVLAVGMQVTDTATAGEAFQEHQFTGVADTALISESMVTHGALRQQVIELGVADDALLVSHSEYLDDTATVSDSLTEQRLMVLTDTVQISEQLTEAFYTSRQITDAAKVSEQWLTVARQDLLDSVVVSDSLQDVLRVSDKLTDVATVTDSVLELANTGTRLTDSLTISDSLQHHLAAHNELTDAAFASDELRGDGVGQAWTANVKGFATSRYYPYDFTSLAVVRGVLYGTRADGIYRLDGVGSSEVIETVLQSASMDLGGDALTVPRYVYLGYESDSEVSLDVSTEQSGNEQSFAYTLPAETAGSATTGRFTLGRGLRGRYYSFKLSTTGNKFRAIEMYAVCDNKKRRV